MAKHEFAPGVAQSVRLRNFRRFEDTGAIALAPVTLILGKNSSGKTSLLRSMLLLKQLVTAPTFEEAPLGGPLVDFGSYKELVFGGEVSRDVQLDFRLRMEGRSRFSASVTTDAARAFLEGVHLSFTLHWNKRQGRPQFSSIAFSSLSDEGLCVRFTRRGPQSFTVEAPSKKANVEAPLSFGSLQRIPLGEVFPPSKARNGSRRIEVRPDYTMFILMDALVDSLAGFRHVGPLRDMPDRAYRIDQLSPESPTASVVNVLERQKQAQGLMSAALRELGMAREVSLASLAPGYVGIVLTDPDTGRADNLTDVGFGVSQVLPVIAALATAPPRSTLLVEQPELHLHPESQGRLADVLVNLAAERKCSLVAETHSEHILLRLMRRVADGTVPPDDVCVLVVNNGEVKRLSLDKRGRLTGGSLPPGFFEEDWEDSMLLAKAAAEQSSA